MNRTWIMFLAILAALVGGAGLVRSAGSAAVAPSLEWFWIHLTRAIGLYAVPVLLALPLLDWVATQAHESGKPVVSQIGWFLRWILPVSENGKVGFPFQPPRRKRGRLPLVLLVLCSLSLLGGCSLKSRLNTRSGFGSAEECARALV